MARSYLESFATGDVDLVASHVDDDFANDHASALGSPTRGAAAYRERLPSFLAEFADLRYEILELIADGGIAAARYVLHARWRGGQPVEVPGCMWFEVVDGRIVRRVDHWDSEVFLRQVRSPDQQARPADQEAPP